jgi:hypothetical protein
MSLVERAKNICLAPGTEWPVIADENTPPATLFTAYALPLMIVSAVAGFIGRSIVGTTLPFIGTYRMGIVSGLILACVNVVLGLVSLYIVWKIINALAPTFGAEKNSDRALKVAVYSYTPVWIAGVLNIFPLLGVLAVLGGFYGLYLMYLGLPKLMKCPQDKALGYTVVVVLCVIVVSFVTFAVGGMVAGAGMIGAGALGAGPLGGGTFGSRSSGSDGIQFDKNSALGKLQDISKKLEESGKKMEVAQAKGDAQGQAAAALEGLGTLLGGGKRVDPIAVDQIKPFVPATFAGLARTSSSAEKNGVGGLSVSKAEASYSDGAQKSAHLEITDGGVGTGLLGLAGWVGVQGEKDNDNETEVTHKVNGRLVHERQSKREGGTNEYSIILADRFVVNARGNGISLAELKSAVGGLDLGKLEAMKDVGVQK